VVCSLFSVRPGPNPDAGNRVGATDLTKMSAFTNDFYLSLALSLRCLAAIGLGFSLVIKS